MTSGMKQIKSWFIYVLDIFWCYKHRLVIVIPGKALCNSSGSGNGHHHYMEVYMLPMLPRQTILYMESYCTHGPS